jgi:hypothetical protein
VNDIEVEQKIGQRRGQKRDARQGELVIEHGAQIAQALLNSQPRPNSGLSRRKICVIPRAQRVR